MESMTMHTQWRSRPADERYRDLESMYAMLAAQTKQCGTSVVGTDKLKIVPINHGSDSLSIVGPSGRSASLTNWSMNQLSAIAHAPAAYLRTLPAAIAADALNHSMGVQPRDDHQLFLRQTVGDHEQPSTLQLRAINSPGYTRIATAKIIQRMMDLQYSNPSWKAPEVYPQGDFGGTMEPCVGFAGDRDAYLCLVDQDHRIADPTDKSGEGLARGLMILNSEVGAKRLDCILFLCQRICGNMIIWGYKQIQAISMRHYGDKIRREWSSGIGNIFADYTRLSAREEESKIQHAAQHVLGAKKDDVIDLLFKKDLDLGRKQLADAYELTARHGADPTTSWGMVQGLTRLSQIAYSNQDDRVALDSAAAKILDF